jgi:hypothetical protein
LRVGSFVDIEAWPEAATQEPAGERLRKARLDGNHAWVRGSISFACEGRAFEGLKTNSNQSTGGSAMRLFIRISIVSGIFAALAVSAGSLATSAEPPGAKVQKLAIQENGLGIQIPYPKGWSVAKRRFANAYELFAVPAEQQTVAESERVGRILMVVDRYGSHSEAVRQLKEIAAEEKEPAVALNIGGWPAIQRRFVAPVARPSRGPLPEAESEVRVTTAIAAGRLVVRLEGRIPLEQAEVADDAQAIGQNLGFSEVGNPAEVDQEIRELESASPAGQPQSEVTGPESNTSSVTSSSTSEGTDGGLGGSPGQVAMPQTLAASAGLAQQIMVGQGEVEVAVSGNGRNIVVARNFGIASSQDGGQTFGAVAGSPNDPSLAFGLSGNFYLASIGSAPGTNTTSIFRSADNGQTFPFLGFAASCPTGGVGACFLDQEHIAADRVNIGPSGGDQVYSVWRNCTPGCQGVMLVCSSDSGATWTAPLVVDPQGDFPRISVGANGTVYVVYAIGAARDGIRLRRYGSCASGLAFIGQTTVVATGNSFVPCPVPGLDRCNDGNVLASPTVAEDDTNPARVYVAYANNTAPGNEDVFVRASSDGGASFPSTVRVNNPFTGRRYMPWVSAVGGAARVSWYDRRASAGSLDNSLTDFYCGSAYFDSGGNLVAGPELKVSPVSDSNCASGWPCAPRAMADSESCSSQPQLAGVCSNTTTRCDFSDGGCPGGVACLTGGGCPKYGDYNGNAAAAGRVYNAWTSATNPQGTRTGLAVYFASKVVCCVPQIQIPGSVKVADTCVGNTGSATLLVCNTGKELLEVGTITSSSGQFSVLTPSSGYPVLISPDFCFPFQVLFSPTSTGLKLATLTVPSNDPVNPSVNVTAGGNGLQQKIATAMADGGRYGNVCLGTFKDLELTIANSGGCDLLVFNITSSSAEFKVATVLSFPLRVQAGTAIHLPIRLEPTSLGMKTANITVTHNDPSQGAIAIPVSGNTPPGDVRVTGSTDFGEVCAGVLAEKRVSVCNVGTCNLNVTSVSFVPPCADFTIVNNPFPAPVSPDSCVDVTIRYTPSACGSHSCNLRIVTDDPDTPQINLTVTGNTPCASIDVPPDQCFAPTVIQSIGACQSLRPFPVSNTGNCPLKITAVTLGGANPGDYALVNLPSFPIILEQGQVIGGGDFKLAFRPTVLGRNRPATVSVTYVSDPVAGTTATVVRNLNGEAVHTGARVLVLGNGVPLASVEKIQLQRINANRNKNQLDTVDNALNLPLQTFVPGAPCGAFQFHREYGTTGNPIQLLPGSYQVTATAVVNGKRRSKTVGFDVGTCGFNANIVISLP